MHVYMITSARGRPARWEGQQQRASAPLLTLETRDQVVSFLSGLRQSDDDPVDDGADLGYLKVTDLAVFDIVIGMIYFVNRPLTGPEVMAGRWFPEDES